MAITINTNIVARTAQLYLERNTASLDKSLSRLSSGTKLYRSSDDPGGLAVSMKLKAAISRQGAAITNIKNALSFTKLQDTDLDAAAKVVNRMAELRSLYDDVTKSSNDIANYNSEFQSLRVQLYEVTQNKFNGISLFSNAQHGAGTKANGDVIEVLTSERGEGGSKVSLGKLNLLSAVTVLKTWTNNVSNSERLSVGNWTSNIQSYDAKQSLALDPDQVSNLTDSMTSNNALVSLGAFGINSMILALQNVASLRAANGAIQSRLELAADHLERNKVNMEAANSLIADTDIAEESTRYARLNILVQAGASMLSQANMNKASILQVLMG